MNQDQRKFLLSHIDKRHRAMKEALEAKMPKEPSLNNHMIAAFMDNSIEYADLDELKDKIRKRVLAMGSSDVLVADADDGWGNRKKGRPKISLDVKDVFLLPKSYLDALKEYQDMKGNIESEIESLDAVHHTLTLKVNIGSNAALDGLIQDVDNLADIRLINAQLTMSPAKQIEDKKTK